MTQKRRTRWPRPIDAVLHGATDYTAGAMLMTVFPRLAGIEDTRGAGQLKRAGAIHAGYSLMTDYPLGLVKAIPFKAHLAIDAIGGLALAATPFLTGQFRKGRKEWVPHVALCAFELGSLALTDPTGRGDYKGDLAAVRASNREDPRRKVYDRTPAVVPGAAATSGNGAGNAQRISTTP